MTYYKGKNKSEEIKGMYFRIHNTFKNAHKVEIEGNITDGERIDITIHPFVSNYENKIITYKYYVDDKIMIHPNKLYYITEENEIMHYIHCDKIMFEKNWFNKSIMIEDPDIIFIYAYDKYNKYNMNEFIKYLEISARNGNAEALFRLANIHYKNIDKQIEYYETAVCYRNSKAMYNLAQIYTKNRPDINKRLMYLLMACEYDDIYSYKLLREDYEKYYNKYLELDINEHSIIV